MPTRRIFCVSLRSFRVLAEFDAEADMAAGAEDAWGGYGLDWIAVLADRSAVALTQALAWSAMPRPDRERRAVDVASWLAVARLVSCGTCS